VRLSAGAKRRWARELKNAGGAGPGAGLGVELTLRALAALALPLTYIVVLPWFLLKHPAEVATGAQRALGVGVLAVGAVVMLSCVFRFACEGKGTLAVVDPPKKLVRGGLYQYSRNPMYLGGLLILLGEAALFASWKLVICAAILITAARTFVVFYEEPKLLSLFGSDYVEYKRRVGRWWTFRW
jgi:protein-S-isoprenylcysteine O-methyltransferase Ste14